MIYTLPKTVEIGDREYSVGWDYRAILDIFAVLNDPDFNDMERTLATLSIFYPSFEASENPMPYDHYGEAIKKCLWFINAGQSEDTKKQPKLIDWEQDFNYIIAPVNRIIGQDIRGLESLHWWTFLSAFYEIGDCTFAQIVRIRDMKARGKRLDKSDAEWYRRNREIVDIKTRYSQSEDELLKAWGGE